MLVVVMRLHLLVLIYMAMTSSSNGSNGTASFWSFELLFGYANVSNMLTLNQLTSIIHLLLSKEDSRNEWA